MQGLLGTAAEVMRGAVLGGDESTVWSGAALDSRNVRGGELFFALPGERSDGHRFVASALAAGASAAVVHETVTDAAGPLVRVEDTYTALHDLTRAMRRRAPRRLVAVTGSAGKTTTKELLAAMLAAEFETARSPGNLNNLYGFPLSLLGIPDDCDWMVAEMGMSTPGELGRVSRLGRPDIAVFTNVRAAHLEAFGTLEAIAEAKAELLEGLAAEGTVVANADDPLVMRIAARHPGPRILFGGSEDADVRLLEWVATDRGGRVRWAGPDGEHVAELALLGRHNAMNFLAAAAAATAAGVSGEVLSAAVADVRPAPGRGVRHDLGGFVVIDDSYNANPEAVNAALAAAAAIDGERRWCVLGDMLELGPEAPEFHREVGRRAAELGFDPVYAVGRFADAIVNGADSKRATGRGFAEAKAARELAAEVRSGDVVLVKGSRGVGLEVVVEAILARHGGGA